MGSMEGRSLRMGRTRHKYSALLPTYNEAENLPIVISLLVKAFEEAVRVKGGGEMKGGEKQRGEEGCKWSDWVSFEGFSLKTR